MNLKGITLSWRPNYIQNSLFIFVQYLFILVIDSLPNITYFVAKFTSVYLSFKHKIHRSQVLKMANSFVFDSKNRWIITILSSIYF
jgi:hypothetical protein